MFLYNLRGHDSLHRLRTWLLKIPNAPSLDAARVAYAELNAAVDLIAAEDEFQNLCPFYYSLPVKRPRDEDDDLSDLL